MPEPNRDERVQQRAENKEERVQQRADNQAARDAERDRINAEIAQRKSDRQVEREQRQLARGGPGVARPPADQLPDAANEPRPEPEEQPPTATQLPA